MTKRHYSIPSYKNVNNHIELTKFKIHQSLIVENDPNGNHDIYTVVDNTPLTETIQQAIDNGHIVLLSSLSATETAVDDITIESRPGFSKIAVEPTLPQAMASAWNTGITGPFDNGIYDANTGALTALSGIDYIIEGWHETVPMPDGVYELYANKNIDSYGLRLATNGVPAFIFDPGVYENGLWRYSVTLTGAGVFQILQNYNEETEPATLWFINRYDTTLDDEVTIKNIDWIIGRDGTSIDGSFTPPNDTNRTIPTQAFVEGRVPTADDITIQDINSEPVRSTVSDINDILNEAVDSNIPTSGWSMNQNNGTSSGSATVTYNHGTFTIPGGTYTTSDEFFILDNNSVPYTPCSGSYFRIYTNTDFDANNLEFILDDRSIPGSATSTHHDQLQLFNGMYELTVFVGGGYQINNIKVNKYGAGSITIPDISIEFIITDLYPSNKISKVKNIDYIIDSDFESIDGSDTPMNDPSRELVTRAYIDSAAAKVDDVTIENDTYFQHGTNAMNFRTNVRVDWDMNSSFQGETYGDNLSYNGGLVYHAPGGTPTDSIVTFNDTVGTDAPWSAGTHYIYSTIPLDFGRTLYLQGYKGDPDIAFTAHSSHDMLYIGEVVVPAGHNINGLVWSTGDAPSSEYYLKVIKTSTVDFEPRVKNAEVINIINSFKRGIKDQTPMFHADHELVTRAYIENYVADNGLKLYIKVLDATDIANKYVTPSLGDQLVKVRLSVGGAPFQVFGQDYDIDTTNTDRLTWDTLGLDGLLEVGDTLEITYEV